ncbi:MAG: hypothetical protein F6J89_10120 [Symploca sp. SIO1C4]|uniref:Uncharacterized protein n=1 Tax=Symploca sp. SIO1C4 TaxID=2607765 RepID=A0A6B3NBL2_9CYAN|nr:hypothetical protein [Symploca sp. SIO1C4]
MAEFPEVVLKICGIVTVDEGKRKKDGEVWEESISKNLPISPSHHPPILPLSSRGGVNLHTDALKFALWLVYV